MPSRTSWMGSFVVRASSAVSLLSCLGSRCGTRTSASPVRGGRAASNCVNASSPPAEAPMPTMGQPSFPRGAALAGGDLTGAGDRGLGGLALMGETIIRAGKLCNRGVSRSGRYVRQRECAPAETSLRRGVPEPPSTGTDPAPTFAMPPPCPQFSSPSFMRAPRVQRFARSRQGVRRGGRAWPDTAAAPCPEPPARRPT